ncbi:uncharacterized protein LOC126839600 isoform X1 [Adelges cooleyi]|uniref:uncharacterized protein LOC126839600 isoform X1 n=1 Tax=Adelges cooleyi TaxID=133065 RepID=UPI0021801B0D|nr:uncharacterized protein LOC126839600 isoform X1 [Adelges cooleyi]
MHNISKGMVVVAVVAWCSFVGQCSFIERFMKNNATGKETLKKLTSVDQAFMELELRAGTVYDYLTGSPQCNDETVYHGTSCLLLVHRFVIDKQTLASVLAHLEAYPEPPPGQDDPYSYEAVVRALNVVESVGVTIMCRFAHLSQTMLAKPSYSPCEHFQLLKRVLYAIHRKFEEHHIPLTPVENLIAIFDNYCRVENPDINYKNDIKEIFKTFLVNFGHLSGFTDLSEYESGSYNKEAPTLGPLLKQNVSHAWFFFEQPQSSNAPPGSSMQG